MYDAHHEMRQYDIVRWEETEAFIEVLLADPKNTARIHGMLEGPESLRERHWTETSMTGSTMPLIQSQAKVASPAAGRVLSD